MAEWRAAFAMLDGGSGPFHFGTFSVVCANNLGGKLMAFFLGNMRGEIGRDPRTANSSGAQMEDIPFPSSFTSIEFLTTNHLGPFLYNNNHSPKEDTS